MKQIKNLLLVALFVAVFSSVASEENLQKALDAYFAGDFNTAFVELSPLAEAGNAEAQKYLGVMYLHGWGVEQSYEEAVKWYLLAVEAGNTGAQYNLGWMYLHGWGVEQNYKEALRLFLLAAKTGETEAQNIIGWMYDEGWGVEQSYEEAVKWYLLAAEAGNLSAQNNLGYMYYNGLGVSQYIPQNIKQDERSDYVLIRSYMWYSLAANQGDETAIENRDFTAKRMTPEQITKAKELAKKCLVQNYKNCEQLVTK